MVNLSYLLIFKTEGIPIYSRCFSNFCMTLMKDDILLSGFLSALTTIGTSGVTHFDDIDFEGHKLTVDYSDDGLLRSIDVAQTKLIFFHMKTENYYIVAGFPEEEVGNAKDFLHVDVLFTDIEKVLEENYSNQKWYKTTQAEFDKFEDMLLRNAVYPWMATGGSSHSCSLGENCPLRVAIIDPENEKKTIWDRLKDTIVSYRKKGMLSKMKMMMSGLKEKMRGIPS